ncbi:MAG TPA: type II toxin-antitoxin system antitoxin SocA domain-containing protein [Kofleriaceae bacterium]|jgi:hypothetical protein|nr:type II toxin-antitoxin system antitoxin SocA domain-containing protein [Kofleriaceae bacterium]
MLTPKLCKALETLVQECGSIDGRTRILKLVYLTDKAWYAKHGETYTEARYFRWNHGPFAREVISALEWMDGIEIVQTSRSHSNGTIYTYLRGTRTRLAEVKLDADFDTMLKTTARKWREVPLNKLLQYVYADATFDATMFGDRLLT